MHPIIRAVAPYVETNGSVVVESQLDVMARVQGFVRQIAYKDGEHGHCHVSAAWWAGRGGRNWPDEHAA